MSGVRVSQHFGIIIRKNAIKGLKIPFETILELMEASEPLDEDESLLSFGPHFGGEAANEFIRRLEGIGLKYGNDFVDFEDVLPEWCQIFIACGDD